MGSRNALTARHEILDLEARAKPSDLAELRPALWAR
jgi:hypothetical protein